MKILFFQYYCMQRITAVLCARPMYFLRFTYILRLVSYLHGLHKLQFKRKSNSILFRFLFSRFQSDLFFKLKVSI